MTKHGKYLLTVLEELYEENRNYERCPSAIAQHEKTIDEYVASAMCDEETAKEVAAESTRIRVQYGVIDIPDTDSHCR
jgi:hypothetical protein